MGVHDGEGTGFFDFDDRLRRLRNPGDQLEAYGRLVDFEAFRPELDKAFAYTSGAHGGRPPYDPVMMLKVLVIQTANNLSDERTEFLIDDRLSFMRFRWPASTTRTPSASMSSAPAPIIAWKSMVATTSAAAAAPRSARR